MSRLPFIAYAAGAVLICAPALVVSRGQEPRAEASGPGGPPATLESALSEPREGEAGAAQVVLLRNGRVLEGRTHKEGDTYVVERPGSKIRLAAASVEMVSQSREGIYAKWRTEILPDDLEGHLGLAHWCLRQDLLQEARLELAAAMALEPEHAVAKRLLLQVESRERVLQSAAGHASGDGAEGDEESGNDEGLREPSAVQDGLFAPGAAAGSQDRGETAAEIADKETAASPGGPPYEWPVMPEHAVGEFTRTIQPLLVNSCTTGGCHNSRHGGGFGMIRIRDPRQVTPETTAANLQAVLEWLDPSNPDNSELLAMSVLAHSQGPHRQFAGLRGRQFDSLARWISSLRPAPRLRQESSMRSGQATAAFKTAMQADAAAPGRRGSTTARRLPSRRAHAGAAVADESEGIKSDPSLRARTEHALADEPVGTTHTRTENAGPGELPQAEVRRGGEQRRRSGGIEIGSALRPSPDDSDGIPDARTLGAPPGVAAYEEHSTGGGALPGVMNGPDNTSHRRSPISDFLRRLNPFRRDR